VSRFLVVVLAALLVGCAPPADPLPPDPGVDPVDVGASVSAVV
jgi:hypothetical protein